MLVRKSVEDSVQTKLGGGMPIDLADDPSNSLSTFERIYKAIRSIN
jgi:hypothetical protein